ncbi:MAG: GNAT family N-acetyltransferase [Spirochaetes bacterium]|nr:GNAT family N-acetyltransferase [Spirochaetota bacterium]
MANITSLSKRQLPEAIRVLRDTWADSYSSCFTPDVVERASAVWHDPTLLDKQMKNPDVKFLAALEGDSLVGLSTVIRRDDGGIVIGRLYVHPSAQHRGIGTRLYEMSIDAFPGATRAHVEVDERSAKGLSFYRKLGFSETGQRTEVIEGLAMKVLILERDL